MSADEPSDLVPAAAAPADLAPARAQPGALVPAPTRVGRGVSWPRSSGFGITAGLVINTVYFGVAMTNLVPDGVLGFGLCALVISLGLPGLHNFWKRRRHERRLDRVPPLVGAPGTRGQLVRLAGVVLPGPTPLRTPRGHRGVLVRYQGCRGGRHSAGWASPWRWELHAIDFCVRADDGRELWVDTRSIVLLPHPPTAAREPLDQLRPLYVLDPGEGGGARSWIFDDETIGPGDLIEVAGTLDLVPHPAGSTASDRGARLRPILRGTPDRPVQVRRHFRALPGET